MNIQKENFLQFYKERRVVTFKVLFPGGKKNPVFIKKENCEACTMT